MEDNRKILVAKRKNDRRNYPNRLKNEPKPNQTDSSRNKLKRPGFPSDCTKNLANNRLKRLRTSLKEDVQKSTQNYPQNSSNTKVVKNQYKARKRHQNSKPETVTSKVLVKEGESSVSSTSGFVFQEKFVNQHNSFATVTENPFPVSKVLETRNNSQSDEIMEWCSVDVESQNISTDVSNISTQNNLFIVVDTNIFLSNMQVIREILSMNVSGAKHPVVFIPWIVLEELDFIKEDSSKSNLRFKAQDAIKFIENNLSEKKKRIMGQTLDEVNEQKIVGKSQDNKIIACCMQVLEKHKNMILLTNDINLKNKAHINNIPACSHNQIMQKITHLLNNNNNNNKSEVILQKMTVLCVGVIAECAKNAYGNACSRMPICQSKQNTLQECLTVFTKYWFPVFQEMLMKQFKKSVDDLSMFLNKNKRIKNGSKELSELVRLCVRMCLFLKDVEFCKDSIEATIRDLNNLIKSQC